MQGPGSNIQTQSTESQTLSIDEIAEKAHIEAFRRSKVLNDRSPTDAEILQIASTWVGAATREICICITRRI